MLARRSSSRALLLLVAALVVSLLPLGATAQDLEEVQERRNELEGGITNINQRMEELESTIVARTEELESLDDRKAELEEELVEVRAALEERARAMFMMGGDVGTLEALVSGEGPGDALERAATMDTLARRDGASVEAAEALRIQLEQTEELRAATLEELKALEAELQDEVAAMVDELETVKILERDLKLKAKRQRMIDRGIQQGIYSCPMQSPYNFIDSWGFARSGGRRHKGVDIMAPHGNQIYAFTSGRISRMTNGGLGGISLYLWGDDGNRYYYTHLSGYAPNTYVGKWVEAGTLIAYNGNTGNARGGAPHLHFEVHPGGGSAVNPYPWTAAACF
ncbi:MAG: peptidoglycan DD-metalloendopeptidase family protein [Nitriliruptorales bacterium]|nr:peptidoglycan DD-metalloendopeptidase family protein [Nitriliruptorales bacterium]